MSHDISSFWSPCKKLVPTEHLPEEQLQRPCDKWELGAKKQVLLLIGKHH